MLSLELVVLHIRYTNIKIKYQKCSVKNQKRSYSTPTLLCYTPVQRKPYPILCYLLQRRRLFGGKFIMFLFYNSAQFTCTPTCISLLHVNRIFNELIKYVCNPLCMRPFSNVREPVYGTIYTFLRTYTFYFTLGRHSLSAIVRERQVSVYVR